MDADCGLRTFITHTDLCVFPSAHRVLVKLSFGLRDSVHQRGKDMALRSDRIELQPRDFLPLWLYDVGQASSFL